MSDSVQPFENVDALRTAQKEAERVAALQSYSVLDTPAEGSYDDITEIAAAICGTPISLISLVDSDRQWFKSAKGLNVRETPRSQSFCAHTLVDGDTLIVSDALIDSRFRDNPLVTDDPHIRFYAGAPIVDDDGHVLGTVCVIDDKARELSHVQRSGLEALARQVLVLLEQRKSIAALQKAAEHASAADLIIRNSEGQLQSFVDLLPALAWIANADGFITWYNARWYTYTGTTPQQMEGWGWQSVHDPVVLPQVLERWMHSIHSGEPFEMVFPLRSTDGEFRLFLTRVVPLCASDGTVLKWFGTNTEVDALQKTQMALEQNETRLNQVLSATSDAVVGVGRDWAISYMNPQAEKLYGNSNDLIGRDLWELFPEAALPGSPFLRHYKAAMYQGVSATFEESYGPPLNFTVGIEVYPAKDGIVTFSRDVTKLKHAAAAVLQNEKLAAVGRMASTIAHEINNPLESVTNLVYLARHAEGMEVAAPYLDDAELELRRAGAIVSRTLRFHKQTTKPTATGFPEFLEGMFVGQHSRLKNSNVEVLKRDRSKHPVTCLEGEIRQVLVNLVGNAIDAMHGTGGTLFVRARDWTSKDGRLGMLLTIADTGTGISDMSQERIFEAFYSTKGIGGTGLGLWLSKEIAERHKGSLTFRSRTTGPVRGTLFQLFLPHEYERDADPAIKPSL